MPKDDTLKHKEVLQYEIFYPAAHGETTCHVQQHLIPCPLCELDQDDCECHENDAPGG